MRDYDEQYDDEAQSQTAEVLANLFPWLTRGEQASVQNHRDFPGIGAAPAELEAFAARVKNASSRFIGAKLTSRGVSFAVTVDLVKGQSYIGDGRNLVECGVNGYASLEFSGGYRTTPMLIRLGQFRFERNDIEVIIHQLSRHVRGRGIRLPSLKCPYLSR